ncbi:S-adenosylmethionine synthetase [Candidatus Saccharibacteria bacterium]|nr:S-adenosylmethionine synthetase [Candidatus Saccharibacteria bacterium]
MFEKVNPSHPDKVADRIAGALVDLAYTVEDNPRIAVEVLIGHGECHIIAETSVHFADGLVAGIVKRIAKEDVKLDYKEVPQDAHLAKNQDGKIRCGDNGIFKGVPVNEQEKKLSALARDLYKFYPTDGKFIIRSFGGGDEYILCQSQTDDGFDGVVRDMIDLRGDAGKDMIYAINPLGDWTGGVNVDSGATNRKLGSDMGRAVTGGGLHGKDLSKADVAVNIYAHVKAQITGEVVEVSCAIGDEKVDGLPYEKMVKAAKDYIDKIGGFERLAEWGLV